VGVPGSSGADVIPPDKLELMEQVGEGRFGNTFRAWWGDTLVAVKSVVVPGRVEGASWEEEL
ncbi:unnamed protein product, partial [Discosporangium mesarthrocarpum]